MFQPIEKDKRYTISREWIGASAFFDSAVMLAIGESARRNGALTIEAVE